MKRNLAHWHVEVVKSSYRATRVGQTQKRRWSGEPSVLEEAAQLQQPQWGSSPRAWESTPGSTRATLDACE